MKRRYLSLFLILTLILTLFGATGVALAQNPQGDPATATVEPTQGETTVTQTDPVTDTAATTEPTVAPTEAPTAEPTAAPTEAPTAEPTVAPTEAPTVEPTVVPTEEPTVAPTEEPTAEPTATPVDLPVVDSFAAAPASLTGDGTTVLTTTLTWAVTGADTLDLNGEDVSSLTEKIVELTQTTTYTLKAVNAGGSVVSVVVVDVVAPVVVESAGDIEAAAVPGTFTSEYVMVQNISASPATTSIDLFSSSSTPDFTVGSTAIPVNGNATFSLSSVTDGKYSAIVSSDSQVVAAVYNVNATGKLGDMYLGFNEAKQELTLPLIYRNHYDQSSVFYIQNAHSAPQDITVKTYLVNTTSPAATKTYTNVPQNTAITVDFANDTAYDGYCKGNGCYGYAVISGANGNIAVVSQQIRDIGDKRFMTSYGGLDGSGITASDAGKDIVAPLVYNNWYGWISGINVVNTETTTATVTMNYYSNKGNGAQTQSIPGNSVALFYLPNVNPQTSFGSARFTSDKNVVVMVNNANATNGWASATAGLNAAKATKKVALPLVLNSNSGSAWRTGINIYSFGSTTITTTFVAANSDPTNSANIHTQVSVASANSVSLLFGPDFLPASNYIGAAYIESKDSNIMVLTNVPNLQQGFSGQMPGLNY